MKSKIPVAFVGHGSPMIAIENNNLTNSMHEIGGKIGEIKGILMISAHWFTNGLFIQKTENPKQIYDMYGFPSKLYEVKYPVKGSNELSEKVLNLIKNDISIDNSWGIDHGSWSILNHIYPNSPYPVVQLSVNALAKPTELLEIGNKLKSLRYDGWLIIGSGNIVHNLNMLNWHSNKGTEKAVSFDNWVKESILSGNHADLTKYLSRKDALYSVPTPEHFLPLFYILGLLENDDKIDVFNNVLMMDSLSMTSYLFS